MGGVVVDESEARDRHFSGFLVSGSEQMDELVRDVTSKVEAAMPRKRARRVVDQQMFEAQVEALVCEAIYRELEAPEQWVTIPRAKAKLGQKSRYRAPVLRESIATVLDALSSLSVGFLEQRKGEPSAFARGPQTTFRASAELLAQAFRLGIDWADLDRRDGEEVIVLKEAREDHWSDPERLEYADTEETSRYREQLREINGWLRGADLNLVSSSWLDVDLWNRHLKRYFNAGSFELGGRLYGGFWQRMNKAERKDLRIDGEQAVELDFSQVGPRILYGMAGARVDRDAYAVPGYEDHREGVKKLFAAMINTSTPLVRFPAKVRELFPRGTKAASVCSAIQRYHPVIAGHFHRQTGLAVMFKESQIMVSALLRMKAAGIVALPVHDAAIVAAGRVDEAKAIMLEEFQAHTGLEGAVSIA
ncbi:hypothetical protein KEH56_20630 [Burkholderia cenocepacia]|uniref:hypothetical protein n=1 Tax=Burkholderia cenocepacia TaxID=95486 RepID=UPI001BA8E461|nr:hypothetical protein [Burkholderia cenocepacia]QUN41756.1 hypothetical protein KEH56_20630 [Burkholderia cenocepacia]QUO26853.1 hypothetical protein KEH57_08065 [Burkholderia cenocepacia]